MQYKEIPHYIRNDAFFTQRIVITRVIPNEVRNLPRIARLPLLYCLLCFLMFCPNNIWASDTLKATATPKEKIDYSINPVDVYLFDIREDIGPAIWRKMQKAFVEATEKKAGIFLIVMNTYGGMAIHADSIRTKILNSSIPVWVFIDNNAASAGALISIACDSIYMSNGASIGAATVVDQTGNVLPDKYQSYMRSMMRATAEAKRRDPQIAQAMVDPRIYIKGITDTGQVLTFTTAEAIRHGFCEAQVESVEELFRHADVRHYDIIKFNPTALDNIIGFLVNPIVSSILLMLIMGGLYFELQTPGVGFPLIAALTAAALYFAPHYLEGLAEHWEIALFFAGLLLLLLELFAFPGFGVAGVAGILCTLSALVLSMVGNIGFDFTFVGGEKILKAFLNVFISLFAALVISILLGAKLVDSPLFRHLVLQQVEKTSEGYASFDLREKELVGCNGMAITLLRPSGKVEIDGNLYDATAETGFIEKGHKVKVVKFAATQLFVRKTET